MKTKTILTLTMACMMGALATTPIFAQSQRLDSINYNYTIDTLNLSQDTAYLERLAKKERITKMIQKINKLSPITWLVGYEILSANAELFIKRYNKAEDKDAFLKKEFSKFDLEKEEYNGRYSEIINAIKNKDIQAFRNIFDNLDKENKMDAMVFVLSKSIYTDTATDAE